MVSGLATVLVVGCSVFESRPGLDAMMRGPRPQPHSAPGPRSTTIDTDKIARVGLEPEPQKSTPAEAPNPMVDGGEAGRPDGDLPMLPTLRVPDDPHATYHALASGVPRTRGLANTDCWLCDAPRELSKISLPDYIIEPPDVLLIEALNSLPEQEIAGEHLVRPDGSVGLGLYGNVHVAGLTLDQARTAIEQHLTPRIRDARVSLDVVAFNSKVYYVITDGGGYGEQVVRLPVTGSETVLDAISQISGLPSVASKRHIWIARPSPNGISPTQTLPIDWIGITTRGEVETNYQLLPGDRIYVQADRLVTIDSFVTKVISPFERVFGFTLLGNATVRAAQFGHRGLGGGAP
jgi:polysaccharide export outer membrane protein